MPRKCVTTWRRGWVMPAARAAARARARRQPGGAVVTSAQFANGRATAVTRSATAVVSPRRSWPPTTRRTADPAGFGGCAFGRSHCCVGTSHSLLVSRLAQGGSEEVPIACHPVQDLVHVQLAQGVSAYGPHLDLGPRARRRDKGSLLAAQRVRRDRRLGGGVLTPVQQHLAGAQGFRHLPQNELGPQPGQLLCDLPCDIADRAGVLLAGQSGIQLHSLAAAGDGCRPEPDSLEPLAYQQGQLCALVEPRRNTLVEVDDQPVGIGWLTVSIESPLWDVELQRGEVHEVGEGRYPVHDGVADGVVAALRARATGGNRHRPQP